MTNEERAGANIDPPKPSRWIADKLPRGEWCLRLPWSSRRRPFLALHIYHSSYELYGGRSRETVRLLLIWGRQFADRTGTRSWEIRGRWS